MHRIGIWSVVFFWWEKDRELRKKSPSEKVNVSLTWPCLKGVLRIKRLIVEIYFFSNHFRLTLYRKGALFKSTTELCLWWSCLTGLRNWKASCELNKECLTSIVCLQLHYTAHLCRETKTKLKELRHRSCILKKKIG